MRYLHLQYLRRHFTSNQDQKTRENKKTFAKSSKYISRLIYMSKSEPLDKELYNKLKKEIWEQYKKPSAYRSAQLVRKYKKKLAGLIQENRI